MDDDDSMDPADIDVTRIAVLAPGAPSGALSHPLAFAAVLNQAADGVVSTVTMPGSTAFHAAGSDPV